MSRLLFHKLSLCGSADRVAMLGMAVALTTTVNLIFGSLVMDPVTGVLFNDEVRILVSLHSFLR